MKYFSILFFTFSLLIIQSCTTKSPELIRLEARQEVLELNNDLNKLKIDFEKERRNQESLKIIADNYADKAQNRTSGFSSDEDPEKIAKNASDAAKALRSAEKASNTLSKSNQKLAKIQSKIDRLIVEISQLEKKIEFVVPEGEK